MNFSDLLLRLLGLSDDAQVDHIAAWRWSWGEGVPTAALILMGGIGLLYIMRSGNLCAAEPLYRERRSFPAGFPAHNLEPFFRVSSSVE